MTLAPAISASRASIRRTGELVDEANVAQSPRLLGRRVAVLTVHHVHVGDQVLTGGAEKYILNSLRALLAAGAAVHVGYSGASIYEELLAEHAPSRLTIERTGWIDDVLSGDARLELKTILERRRWLRATRADTLFAVQQAAGGAFAASLIAAKTLGMRVVSSIRQQPEPLPSSFGKRWLGIVRSPELWRQRLIWRRLLPAWVCDTIIYNSRRVADAYAIEYGFPCDKTCIIPNGETPSSLRDASQPGELNIGTAGRISEAKGVYVLLDAFAQVSRKHPRAVLTFYGDGPHAHALRARVASLGLAHRVRFPGYVADRRAIYSGLAVYAQVSLRESMSNSVLEAMAHGLPCVVTDVGGQSEVVVDGGCGHVIRPGSVAACAAALDHLLAHGDMRESFGKYARDRIQRRFHADEISRRTAHAILGMPF